MPLPSPPDFQLLFEKSPASCLVLLPDADFTIVAVSDSYLHATRTSRQDILGRPLFEVFPHNPADPSATGVLHLRASLERVMATRAADTMAVQKHDIPRPVTEGSTFEERYWNPVTTPVLSSTGEVRYIILQVEDVTDSVHLSPRLTSQARTESERQRAWLHALFMQAPTAIAILQGPQYIIELANPLQCRIWGRRPEQVLGRPTFEAIPEAAGQGFEELLDHVRTTGEPYVGTELPVRLARLEGGKIETAYFNLVYEPMHDAQGHIEAILAVASEVTDLVRARQRVEVLAAEEVRVAEERLRLATKAMNLGTWDMNLETGTLVWDERMRSLLGLQADTPLDHPTFLSHVHPEDRKHVDRQIREVLTSGGLGVLAVEYRTLPLENGTERWVCMHGQVHRDASGRPIRLLGTGLDITEHRRAAEQVAHHSAILEAILLAIPDALYVGDATGIKQANTPALEMLGFQSLEELNQNIATLGERLQNRSFKDGHRLTVEEEPFMRAFRGQPTIREVRTRNLRTGEEVVVRCAAAPVRVGNDIVGAVAVNTDITDFKNAELELRRTAEFRELLLGVVSHDLRGPLNAILLSANTLMRCDGVAPPLLKSVRRIAKSAERMGRMITDLLDFTRGRLGGGIPITRRPANLRHICQHVLEELEAGHPQRELRLSAQGDFQGEWDPDRLAQLLGNLGKNALDYSPEGTPVDCVLRDEGDTVCVRVHNEGAPIPAELLPHLFDPFRRGHGKNEGPGSGLGLGLYIVDQIARAHGGRVEVRSTLEEGTTFTLWLPRSAPASRG